MAKPDVASIPLSRFGILVAQLESIAVSARQQSPDALLCFDLLSELVTSIDEEPKESILQWQRKCEDALYSLLTHGARRPVRRLASVAMVKVIGKGDGISIYSRASSLQGWLADGKRSELLSCAGAAQCLGELYSCFGRRITSGLVETTHIVSKLMKFHEDFVRQDALQMLENALEGSAGNGPSAAYSEAFRIIVRVGCSDKSYIVRLAGARCLKAFANIGGPGLGTTEMETSISQCIKALEDPVSSVRDAFAEALGAFLALAINPEVQVKQRGKISTLPAKKSEDALEKHLLAPFTKASGARMKELHVGIALSWVFFLQVIHLKYRLPESELQRYGLQALELLQGNASNDAHALACVLYILRVGVADQMTEPMQRSFLVLLAKKLEPAGYSQPVGVAALRILSYLLATLGEVPVEFKEVLDDTVVAALSNPSAHVRIEAALTIRTLAEIDPTCVGGLISYGVTTLHALRESAAAGKGNDDLNIELDSLHGQATVLAALVSISPKLILGYPDRLPKSIFDVLKKMLTEFSRLPAAATVEKESGWLLLASLMSSMPKEELNDQVFDILLLWAGPFVGDPEFHISRMQDLSSEIGVLSVAIEALTAFIRSFVTPTSTTNAAVFLQPVLTYLSGALSYISNLRAKELKHLKPALDLLTIRTLMAYQSLSDPMSYRREHSQILQICTTVFSDPSKCEESSCLRFLLDKRDACLGPWTPGRDWFEDELRAFDGGDDGILPCVWNDQSSSFPRPESLSRMLVNQKLLVLGIIFACQDSDGKMQLLNKIDHCLKAGKKQPWYMTVITNACVGLLASLKSVSVIRPHQLGVEILSSFQSIFQGILAEAGTSSAQRRASSEGLGLLARLGNDIFTARMMRSLLGDLGATTDPNYSGCIAFALGCIHRCAGGMALSTMVPATVTSISSLAKSSNAGLQLWSLHALLLTIEAAGLSYVSQVQGTLYLAIEVLLTEENGLADLRQEIGRLVNAIVAVLGPELAPGSTFFARCKSLIAEISSSKATSALLESVRFTQQLVLFAPQAVPVHSHIQNLLPTLFSRQPILRHLTASTLRHLIEKDPGAVGNEQIEEDLFSMLDEETDSEIASLVRASITRLLYASCPSRPSRWLMIFRKLVLSSSARGNAPEDVASYYGRSGGASEDDVKLFYGEDDEGTIASSSDFHVQGSRSGLGITNRRSALLRYRTRVFAAECLSQLPVAVGTDPVHFDLGLARMKTKQNASTDCLVFHLQEMISLSYQVSTGQFEGMQPIGVKLLSVIVDKFGNVPDPDLPEHILLEQYQAQLVSAVRSSITTSSGPLLLEAGLQLATKILTSSILSGDRVALSRMFSLISRPLNDIEDLYYPSFAEWVACKIKVRLLAAHASIKCFAYSSLIEQNRTSKEYLQLIPQFSSSSNILGKYWIRILKDYSYICFSLQSKNKFKLFLDGIQSPLVSSKVQECLDEAWPLILKAIVLDAAPVNHEFKDLSAEHAPENGFISGSIMVRLAPKDFHFLWGLALLILFQQNQSLAGKYGKKMLTHFSVKGKGDIAIQGHCLAPSNIPLLVIQSLSKKLFFCEEYLTVDLCRELLEVLLYADAENLWTSCVALMLSQMVQSCPVQFLEVDELLSVATELYLKCLYATLKRDHPAFQNSPSTKDIISELSIAAQIIASQMKGQGKVILSYLSICYECLKGTSTESCISKTVAFLWNLRPLFQKYFQDEGVCSSETVQAWASILVFLSQDCIKKMHFVENKFSDSFKFLAKILSACLEEVVVLARLVHDTQHHSEREDNKMILVSVYKVCIKSFQDAFCDPNLQVQLISIHVLKSVAQRELADVSSGKSHLFLLSVIGEISEDLFLQIQNKLQGNITRDSVLLIEENLRLLFVTHTLSQASSYSSAVMRLFLEALVMVFYAEGHQQPETKTIASRLLSHVVQTTSSAVLVKELMLSMPPIRRQQLQDMIRASIGQSQPSLQTKAINPPPIVAKWNPQTDPRTIRDQKSHASIVADIDKTDINEEEEEEDEDWDAFQSLPANHASGSVSNNDNEEPKTASSEDGPSSQSPAAKSRFDSFSDYVDTGVEVTSAGTPIYPETNSRLVFDIDHGENIGLAIASAASPTSSETDGNVISNTEGPEVLDDFSAVRSGDQIVSARDDQQMVQTTCPVDEISVNGSAEELNTDSYDLSLSSHSVEEAGNHH